MKAFSVTDLGNWRRCREKWNWSSNARMNLTGVGAGAEELELGSVIHRALADWILHYVESEKEATQDNYLLALFLDHVAKRQTEIEEAFEKKTGYTIPKSLLESLHNSVQLGMKMMQNYQLYHKTPIPKNMTFASPEQEVQIPVPGTEYRCTDCFNKAYVNNLITVLHADHITMENSLRFPADKECKECNGTGVCYIYLTATLDGLLQDEREYLYVLEHKTYKNRPVLIDLQMNDQFTGYAWVVYQLDIGTVGGIAYDGMWKRDAIPTRIMDASTKKYRPGKLEDLFIRKILPKSENMILQWGRNLTLEIKEMANNPEIYPNVPWQGCGDCNFRDVCIMKMNGEDPSRLIDLKYTQREVVRGGQAKPRDE